MDPTLKRILIVDDTPENIQVLGSVLRQKGYLINVAMDGQQAVDVAHNVQPDLILLDIMMPVMDGFEACRQLKSDPATREIPVIFLTARVESGDIVKGFELGGVDYVRKPFNAAELLQRISTHLYIRDLQQRLELRADELTEAANRIRRMARENESFLRHELTNALAPIAGYADLLMKGVDRDSETRVSWARKIQTQTEAMRDLLQKLRDMHALEQGVSVPDRKDIDLMGLIVREIDALQLAFPGVQIPLQSGSSQVHIPGDAVLLQAVFRNLIKNAVEHVSQLAPTDQHLGVEIAVETDGVFVTIRNGGKPLTPERLVTFFDKFNSDRSEKGGLGLGTSYARIVVEAHQGSVSVESSSEEGTRVQVYLPFQ